MSFSLKMCLYFPLAEQRAWDKGGPSKDLDVVLTFCKLKWVASGCRRTVFLVASASFSQMQERGPIAHLTYSAGCAE